MPEKIIVVHPKPKPEPGVFVNEVSPRPTINPPKPEPNVPNLVSATVPASTPKSVPQAQLHHVRIEKSTEQPAAAIPPIKPPPNNEEQILPKRKESCSARSVKMKVSLDQLTHDQPPNVDPIADEAHQPCLPTGLIVTGFLQLILGISVISGDIALFVSDAKIQEYLDISGAFNYESEHIKLGTQVVRIAAGSIIIIGIMYGINFILHIYTHFQWVIVTLDLIVISCSLGTWTDLRMSIYERGFEADMLIYCEQNQEYIKIWEQAPLNIKDKIKPGFWQKLEKDLKCCGMNGPRDWKRMCNKIPESCCSDLHPTCKKELATWNDDRDPNKNLSLVKNLLYEKTCKAVLVLEHDGEHRDRIILPSVILVFDFLLMLNGNHLSKELILKLRKSKGRKEFRKYQVELWENLRRKFTCQSGRKGGKKNQITPSSNDCKIDQDSCKVQRYGKITQNEPGRPVAFVTDRVSLEQLITPNKA